VDLKAGDFIELRGRPWLVEQPAASDDPLATVGLSCIADDAQGERLDVLLDAEVSPAVLGRDEWSTIGVDGTDSAEVLAAYLRVLKWNSATAAERDLLQAPFRAGIKLDAYQLLPLRKALRLPRINLLIADDVGLGKTIEAGLIVREMLLRRRVDFIVVAAPPAMTQQWRDELAAKFGLAFQIIDRDYLVAMRQARGFGTNPWRVGSRFIISHRLLTDEVYAADLREALGGFRTRALFILDEAHHAAPSAGGKYAISSQFTKAVRDLGERFEHRLFLSATPHNGHSNSFSALLEMLDPQRFTRGVEIRPKELEPVMVRRLKSDLRLISGGFPKRTVEAIVLDGLPETTPELDLARRLAEYGELRMRRIARLPAQKASLAKLAFVGLQQRLLSSVAAFARTLAVHRRSLLRLIEGTDTARETAAARAFVAPLADEDLLGSNAEDSTAEAALEAEEDAAVEAASRAGALSATQEALQAELAAVDEMLAIAERASRRPDARVEWLTEWIRANLIAGERWNERRLIIFTEYEDTRRWLEKRLREAFGGIESDGEAILVFSGVTSADRREEVKLAFNEDPAKEPVRILLCTDAAREGINLQTHCADLLHFDLPWNPSRLEQRNGRIDRKLQPAPEIFCRYFLYRQRAVDVVLDALVKKTETIREELGSVGQVIEDRIAKRLAEDGIRAGGENALAEAIRTETDVERLARARAEMDDTTRERHDALLREQDVLRKALEDSRKQVGVDPNDLRRVVEVALSRNAFSLAGASAEKVDRVETYRFDPEHAAFAREPGWADAFDDLRKRPRKRGERLNEWRKAAPVRAISFETPETLDGRLAPDVVQVHLEHRLVRRLLSRFISQGFKAGLSRVSVIRGPGAQARVVLMGRLSLYGEGAARLHEEIIPISAIWSEADRDRKPLRSLGEKGGATTMAQLEEALRNSVPAPPLAAARVQALIARDVEDLKPALESAAQERLEDAAKQLAERGEQEAKQLETLLANQHKRIAREIDVAAKDQGQLTFGFAEEERRERDLDRKHWAKKLGELDRSLAEEPARIRQSYVVKARRLEPVGLVYLWPQTG
jgi:SNF2 family DNA or RNA helicase